MVARAAERGVRMLALTDHDELSGLPEAGEQAAVQRRREALEQPGVGGQVDARHERVIGGAQVRDGSQPVVSLEKADSQPGSRGRARSRWPPT